MKLRLLLLPAVAMAGLASPSTALAQSCPPAPADASQATYDDQMVAVAIRVPGFAGIYLEESSNTLVVLATNPSSQVAENAQDALFDILGEESLATMRPRAMKATYTWCQLKAWYDPMSFEVLGMEGVVSTDIDEKRNRLAIGLENLSLRPQLEAKLAALGVPLEAVIIEQQAPITTLPLLPWAARQPDQPAPHGPPQSFPAALAWLTLAGTTLVGLITWRVLRARSNGERA
jgi:hypothetical protein